MLVYKGRPQSCEGRAEREIRVYDFLDKLDIEYYRVDHEEAKTMDDCEMIDKSLETVLCKNLVLCNSQRTKFYLLMMPGAKPFRTKELSHQINSARLSFAPPEYLEKYLDVLPGSVSIMGLMNDKNHDITLLIDEDVVKPEFIGCHPCMNTSSLKIKTDDVLNKFLKATGHTPTFVTLDSE
ncbi:MAG: prolyl-tRNA synthetase associated domain-containing protein [Clostridia bacterium]|nr:prolyl-tRNA synthetase associated domain-containing protein [Clostridia bacterium]